jgi:pentapeptide MXKDX repeat protein
MERRVRKYGYGAPARNTEVTRMRKLIIATTALAFLSSTAAFAQDKAAAPSGDSMSKSEMSKDKMSKKSKKAAKKSSDDTTKQ